MKAEIGDIVTIVGEVVKRIFNAPGGDTLEILLNDDMKIRLPADYEFKAIRKPPYTAKAGHWVTWGDGTSGYQCLWVHGDRCSGGYMLLRRHAYDEPFVKRILELNDLRRGYGPRGDAEKREDGG